MGLKDRLTAAKRYVWSPMTLTMLERGSDPVAHAGRTAKVIVDVEGEDDGTGERIELRLKLNEHMDWPVGEVPMRVGRHELDIAVPVDAPPTSLWTTYYWTGKLHRTKGIASEAMCPVRVIGNPDHVFRPDGPDASDDTAITLDQATVNVGEAVSGRVTGSEKVEAGYVLDAPVDDEQQQEFKPVAEAQPGPDGAFRLDIPVTGPPTLFNQHRTRITWEVRAGSSWRRFVVLDTDGQSEVTELKSSLTEFLS